MHRLPFIILIVSLLIMPSKARSQGEEFALVTQNAETCLSKSTAVHHQRLWLTGSAHIVAWTGTLVMLDQLWYKDYPRSSFHFHNDAADWLQLDKAGHGLSAYQLSRLSYQSFIWAGLNNKKAALWGSISGNLMLTTIEILDGFSAQWGASMTDVAANALGSISFLSQQLAWNDQRIVLKYSFSPSGLEQYRPELLGRSISENMLKDYNGQTFWLSANIRSLTGGALPFLPSWLNISVGYGGMGMLGSRENPAVHNFRTLPQMPRYRQFYLSPDIDLTKINTRYKPLRLLLQTLNFIKFPAPALEYNTQSGLVFHWLFF